MKLRSQMLLIVLTILTCKAHAEEPIQPISKKPWYYPQFVSLQYAGNLGFVSLGVGTHFFRAKLQTSLIYGYVPKSIAKTEIHTISIKNAFIIDKKSGYGLNISSYLGHTLSFETGNNSFVKLPDKYPKGYYSSNAFHFTLFIGGKIHKDLKSGHVIRGVDMFTELGTVDTYLWYWINSKEVNMGDILSLALGMNVYF